MNKNESIRCLFLFVIAIMMIGVGNSDPMHSGLAAAGCIIIICLGAYSVAKTKEENF